MQQFVHDLLNYARVESEARPLEPVALDDVARGVVASVQAVIAATGATVDIAPLPAVLGDRSQLTRLLQNLVSNAVKFRRAVPPRISVAAHDDGEWWRLEVADNGIGIDMQFQERVFEMFQRLNERGQFEGNGMGLAIVRRIVQRHGGRVWFDSTPGEGTRFFVTLRKVPA